MSTDNRKGSNSVEADEDPRARAAARAAVLRGHLGDDLGGEETSKFDLDRSIIPDGWDYEWKRVSLLGKTDDSYEVSTRYRGWEPVPVKRHRHMMPEGYQGQTIVRDGLMLMERPMEITDEVRRKDKVRARDQVRAKEEQLSGAPAGTFERDNKGRPMASIKKSIEAVAVPEK